MEQQISPAYEELGPTQRLTSTEPQLPRSSAKTARLIAELGLRYRPSAQVDLEAHAAMLALLTKDLAGANPDKLEAAIGEWVKRERFMPRAAELFDLIRKMEPPRENRLKEHADNGNAKLAEQGRTDIRWIVEGDTLRLVPTEATGASR